MSRSESPWSTQANAILKALTRMPEPVGGMACTGCSGEEYAEPGRNALVLETTEPWEFIELFGALRTHPAQECALRRAARLTAQHYTWPQIIEGILLPRLRLLTVLSSPEAGRTAEVTTRREPIGTCPPAMRRPRR